MATVESIINEALESLGHQQSEGLSGTWTDKHALMALRAWPTVRDDVTARHPWSFAKARILLSTPASPTPVYGFAQRFLLPSDCVRLLSVGDPPIAYEIDGGYILADADSIVLRYVRRMDDPTFWAPWFTELMVSALAARIAYRVTNSSSEADRRQTEYLHKLHFATAVDASEYDADVLGDEYPLIEVRFW